MSAGNMQAVADGLVLLLRLKPGGHCSASDDEIFAGGPPPADINLDDLARLRQLGWAWDEKYESWVKLV